MAERRDSSTDDLYGMPFSRRAGSGDRTGPQGLGGAMLGSTWVHAGPGIAAIECAIEYSILRPAAGSRPQNRLSKEKTL